MCNVDIFCACAMEPVNRSLLLFLFSRELLSVCIFYIEIHNLLKVCNSVALVSDSVSLSRHHIWLDMWHEWVFGYHYRCSLMARFDCDCMLVSLYYLPKSLLFIENQIRCYFHQ